MRLLFLTIGKRITPSTRFRVEQYIKYLEADGIECTVKNIPHSNFQRFSLLKKMSDFSAVIIQKKLFSALEIYLLKRANKNIIYDFDDLVTGEHPIHGLTPKVIKVMKRNEKRFFSTLKSARGVIAGNYFLQKMALLHNQNVAVVPTPVEMKNLPIKKVSQKDNLIIGWIGTKSNLFYLDHYKSAWQEISKKFPKTALKIVCSIPYERNDIGITVINKEWSAEDETSDLLSFDVGIMPLTDDDWSKGKCGFKLLQYMAVGLPTVASAIGTNVEITKHGVNGFLANSDAEWVESLSKLLTDAELRKNMGAKARIFVDEKYSVRVCKDRLITAIKSFINA